jgi:hypothetical protein
MLARKPRMLTAIAPNWSPHLMAVFGLVANVAERPGLGRLLFGSFVTLGRRLLLDPEVRATMEQRRHLVASCRQQMGQAV